MSLTLETLEKLVEFDTVSSKSNLNLIKYLKDFCAARGAVTRCFFNRNKEKAGLIARFGPNVDGGVIFSGHTDVVPITGQNWTRSPFKLTRESDRLYGRGTTDMKGFLACMLSAADIASNANLIKPLTLIFSYDEELGCFGIQEMKTRLRGELAKTEICVVGEPTEMQVAIGHKGKTAFRAACIGQPGHSALSPKFVNALYVATDFVCALQKIQEDYIGSGSYDDNYDIPYTTFHVGKLAGGRALNIVPDEAKIDFETRYLVLDGESRVIDHIIVALQSINLKYASRIRGPVIRMQKVFSYPGFDVSGKSKVVQTGLSLVAHQTVKKVAFGTEAGVFNEMGIPTIVCGPGSMEGQGHKPDEYISLEQMKSCEIALKKSVALLI